MPGKCEECGKWYWSKKRHHKKCVSIKAQVKAVLKRSFGIFFVMFIFVTQVTAWETMTPLGITIRASDFTIQQYEKHWFSCSDTFFPFRPYREQYRGCSGFLWQDINWMRVDEVFLLLQAKHQSFPDPTKLKIVVVRLQYNCVDEEATPGYEMSGCIDGRYPSSNTLWIHLGDDSGQGGRAFCGTALSHELNHYFLYHKGDYHWRGEYPSYDLDVDELCP